MPAKAGLRLAGKQQITTTAGPEGEKIPFAFRQPLLNTHKRTNILLPLDRYAQMNTHYLVQSAYWLIQAI